MTQVEAVLAALERVISLADNESPKDLTNDTIRFRAIERWWVLAGNAAKVHAHTSGLPHGAQPWSALAGIRDALAHHRADEADPALLHQASTEEAVEIIEAVRASI